MSNDTKPPKRNRSNRDKDPDNQPDDQGPQFNWKGILILVLIVTSIPLIFQLMQKMEGNIQTFSYSPGFTEFLDSGRVRNVVIQVDRTSMEQVMYFDYTKEGKDAKEGPATREAKANVEKGKTIVDSSFLGNNTDYVAFLREKGVKNVEFKSLDNTASRVLWNLLPIVLFFGLIWFLFARQFKQASRGAFSFGKSKAKMMSRDKNRVTFKDVAGIEEAKDEVEEIVEFLKDPKRFQKLGGRIPKGVLMVGPPGTGKTLLAKAIAGEADVPFFSISGSDFVEMFVGVGASRVRDMFETGKKNAPCLIFIDEIDAVGRHRGHGMGGGHDEREQTLNALLVEMDGFDTQEGIIIIAATNRKDVLDPALLRPGRFDREVHVSLPDVRGREQILKVHAKKIKLSEDVDLGIIAKATPGFSGAELANLINEAALSAARHNKKSVSLPELEEARDKVCWGRERRSLAMTDREKNITAWHEAGHAIVNLVLKHTDPLHKVTIIPRGGALGLTMMLPEGNKFNLQRKEALDDIAVCMAGRIAEELYTHDISTGASADIQQATNLARRMVCEWGMSSLGMIKFTESRDYVFLGRDMGRGREYSEKTAQDIDAEVKKIIDEAYARAKAIITEKHVSVELLANSLLEYETLDAAQVRDLMENGKMSNPPTRPKTPPPAPPSAVAASHPETQIPPGLEGAPAGA
ncbi:MAG: ATP-dependent zinc metalloprotease FtsH [Verrucomicrobiae bacterium]|nr:ATP-dependent zinc metalloprotease FtsH [Verrucomicrobiae bacterium]